MNLQDIITYRENPVKEDYQQEMKMNNKIYLLLKVKILKTLKIII